jgi:prepilin-type N-terminal cleavage/methylation domain-containing protein
MIKETGFSTVELMIVIGIIALLSAVAGISYTSMGPSLRLSGSAQQMHEDRGFTLIEVLIAVIILTTALLGGVALIAGIMRGNVHSDFVTTGTVLAQEKIEAIKMLGYSGTPSADVDSTEDYNSIPNYPLFKRVTSTDADDPGSNMKTITVTVYWDSDSKSVALQTILARDG